MSTCLFSDAQWESIVAVIAAGFAMDPERRKALTTNPTAKLIAALPFLAGCREPERSAIAHLAVFVVGGAKGSARAIFDHKKSDDYDVLARLAALSNFEGGDPAVISRGMKLLAIVMVSGYRNDVAKDKAAGSYNPVGSGAWKADELVAALRAEIDAAPNAEMEGILDGERAVRGWWEQ
jgi:hypothetical protein